jgi:hypothetical protein
VSTDDGPLRKAGTARRKEVEVKYNDLEFAFDYLNSGDPYEKSVYVSRSTGQTFFRSDMADIDELPDDVEENDDYVEIPNRYDLDLGKKLVWDFVDRQIPGLKNKVQRIFSRRGAYSRYKAFLADLELLDAWHRFEGERTKEVLLEWCKDEGVPIDE